MFSFNSFHMYLIFLVDEEEETGSGSGSGEGGMLCKKRKNFFTFIFTP